MHNIIAFQGHAGAYSDLACRAVFPTWQTLPCESFEDVFAAVHAGKASRAMIPVENSTAGRVADIHHLIPDGGLHIVAEHYQPVEHHLLGLPGSSLANIHTVHSHEQALSQCRQFLRQNNITAVAKRDTAGAAAALKSLNNPGIAAIASRLAGEMYGLESLAGNIADQHGNTTRFVIMATAPHLPEITTPSITTLIFRVRSVPAALYKALGGFATNGINISKLESYIIDNKFTAAQFYADIEGHPHDSAFCRALEELGFFADEIRMLGTYPAHPFRLG